jgi:methylenetetrahydrofolate reductase (NADPH)
MTLEAKIKSGEFAVIGEYEPPKGADLSALINNANRVRGRIDAYMIPEMANAVMKASSLGGCAYLQNRGLETILQVCCRDRNRLALQADIIAAAALGVVNVMAVPGEEIKYGDHPQARTVNDLDLMDLLEVLQKLEQGKDMAGIELIGAPRFFIGSPVDIGASGGLLDIELENLGKKIELGVKYVITNPVFDLKGLQQFVKRIDSNRIAVIPTVLLLKSAGMARYIDRNIKGISIPQELIANIQKAPDKREECIRISGDLVTQIKEMGMAGVLISAAGWEDKIPQILDRAKL